MTDKDTNKDEIPADDTTEEVEAEETPVKAAEDAAVDKASDDSEVKASAQDDDKENGDEEDEEEEDKDKEKDEEEEEEEDEEKEEDVEEDEDDEERGLSAFDKVAALTSQNIRTDRPEFRPGDSVKVHVKIIEGNKERIQVFEGVVIAIKHGGMDKTFTVRKNSWGVGVERTFFINSPKVDRIEVARRGRVRRAKLYYLRDRAGKAARIKERRQVKK